MARGVPCRQAVGSGRSPFTLQARHTRPPGARDLGPSGRSPRGTRGTPEACLPPPAPQGCTHPREPRQRDPPPTSPVGATCRTSVCDEETVVSSHSFCSDFPRNAFVGVIIEPSTGTPAGRPPPQPPPPGRPASSLLAVARRLPSPTAGKQVSSTPGSRGCGSGRHTPTPGATLAQATAAYHRLPGGHRSRHRPHANTPPSGRRDWPSRGRSRQAPASAPRAGLRLSAAAAG